ncbi:hypothetical protein BJ878DRAFT_448208 [Calycina marina]|uniref:Myb-like DNA-binding domain-containing protein n=1 Tax=Calycina marina TaxID=1763456 RepID=A0A9P7YWH8_9HELO|nr:hypothetical protein BJ878DRAFT_448208 [Calycina marina]
MSDNEGKAAGEVGIMPTSDITFLIACLQNTTGGAISIDNNKVAEKLQYKNPRSVGNKVNALKKKYNLPFGSSKLDSPKKASYDAGPAQPTVPKTPSKNKVTKPRGRSTGTKNKGKAKKEDDDEEMKEEDEEADNAVKSPKQEEASNTGSEEIEA